MALFSSLFGPQPKDWLDAYTGTPLTIQQQQLTALQTQVQLAQAHQYQARPKPLLTMNVRELKLRTQVEACVRVLPTRICVHVVSIEYWNHPPSGVSRFTVTFDNQKTLDFEDVDNFPSDEHIARIALECP